MPLNPVTLTNAILKLTDPDNAEFVGFPAVITAGALDVAATNQQVATNWASTARAFFTEIVIPFVNPAAHAGAESAFSAVMAPLIGAPGQIPPTAPAALAAGFAAYAGVLAIPASLLPPPGIAVPPPAPLVIVPGPPTSNAAVAAAAIAATVNVWAKTGTFTPLTPPGAPPLFWS